MSLHLQRDLELLKKDLLGLGDQVEAAINTAIQALNSGDNDLCEKVFRDERLINEKEVAIEEDCLKILALHQPVAVDLRFLVVVLKVNNDLERMGDFAVNMAKRARFLAGQPPIPWPTQITETMFSYIPTMVHGSLDALVKLDIELARKVIEMDNAVDKANQQMYEELQNLMRQDVNTIERAISLLSTSRYMERIADLATNIAEEVLFMVEGEVVRHQMGI